MDIDPSAVRAIVAEQSTDTDLDDTRLEGLIGSLDACYDSEAARDN